MMEKTRPSSIEVFPITTSGALIAFESLRAKYGTYWSESIRSNERIDSVTSIENSWIASRDVIRLLQKIPHEKRFDFISDAARSFQLEHLSESLADKILKASSLSQAITLLIDTLPQFTSVRLWSEKIGDYYMLCHDNTIPMNIDGREYIEYYRTLQLISFCQNFLGFDWQPKIVNIQSSLDPVPHSHKLPFHLIKGQKYCSFTLPVDLDINYLYIESHLNWSESILNLIETYIGIHDFSFQWISRITGISVSTLQRRLSDNGTSFKHLVEIVRKKRAKNLLSSTSIPVEEIAFSCGYSDVSNFNRAFKHWFKLTPRQYRDNLNR